MRTSYGYQDLGESVASDDRSEKPEKPSPPSYSKEDYGQSWSFQECKSGAEAHDRSGKPEQNSWDSLERVDPLRGEHLLGRTAHSARNEETIHERTGRPDSEDTQGKADFEKFIVGSDTTEFVNKVKNQVRIRQKRMSNNVAEDCTEHSITWGMFMATTLNAATFMGKNYSTMQNVVQNEEKITLKQMFDITAQIINVPSNVQSARQEALLYVFEDNEAVIKMTIKGRSLTMRNVSRTHRVPLDWLFDRINLASTPRTN